MRNQVIFAVFAASIGFATAASANTFDRSNGPSVLSDRSLNTAAAEPSVANHHRARLILATTGDATGGPSGGPNQAGGG